MSAQDIVCIVDANSEDRDVINRILSRAAFLVRDYEDAYSLLGEIASVNASCAIIDVRLCDVNAPALAAEIARIRPDVPCVVTANPVDMPLAREAIKSGAVDFFEKPVETERLLQTVRHAIESRPAPASVANQPLRPCRIERLTPRERDVLDLLVQGYQNKMIAYELGISQRTVEVYRARVMRRLNVSSFAELVRIAVEEQLAAAHRLEARHERH